MDRNVLVSVTGMFLAPEEGEADKLEVVSPGEYCERSGSRYILYEEHSTDFDEPVRNLIRLEGSRVEILKRGLISADLVFEEGTENMTHYTTPYGSIVMVITADSISISEQPDTIDIRLDYRLELNYEHSSDCSITINVRNAGMQEQTAPQTGI